MMIHRQVKSLYCAAKKRRGTFDQFSPAVKNVLLGAYSSDVVETVTFETETWLKLRDRD